MIAGCIEQMSRQACGTCDHRADCKFVVPELFGALFQSISGRGEQSGRARPFWNLLSGMAKAQSRRRSRSTSVRKKTEQIVEAMLAEGPVRIEEVGRQLGCSRQTLYRRLKEEGTTFETLVADLRHRRAVKMVRDPALSVKEIAYRLGFSDPAAFSRAFKRWTGSSPSAMRAQSG